MDNSGMMATKEAAAYLELAPATLWKRVQARTMPYRRVGANRLLFVRAELDSWLEMVTTQEMRLGRRLTKQEQRDAVVRVLGTARE
jgi:excisionase family DNA binding protein